MADTPNHEYNVPDQGDQDWHNPLNENFEDFDTDIEIRDTEANLSTYDADAGAKFLATDTGVVYTGDGNNWIAQFVLPGYNDSAGEAQFGQPIVASELDIGTLRGSITNGASLTNIAGNNLSIDNSGQLNASGGGGGGGNWTATNNLLEPTDSNIVGIDVDAVNASLLEAGSSSVTVTVGGARALELTAEGGNTAGNVLSGHSSNSLDSGVVGATISGGGFDDGNLVLPNTITGNYGSIGGGFGNETTSDAATVAGGRENTSSDIHAAVGGGFSNTAGGKGAAVGGGEGNDAYDDHGTVGGGQGNEAGSDDGDSGSDTHATVGGGQGNTADGGHSTIGGGESNTASGRAATVGAGSNNTADGVYPSICGGTNNDATGNIAMIGGGDDNEASGLGATVAGGRRNVASGEFSFAVGFESTADGDRSFAAGRNATTAGNEGTFVWGDSTQFQIDTVASNSVVFQAGGDRSGGPAVEMFSQSDPSLFSGVQLAAGDGSWSNLCSETVKTNHRSVDAVDALAKVESMEIGRWEYKTQNGVDHMGPIAEEFNDAFGLGIDEQRITTVDANGVALAAIQGLSETLEEKDDRIEDLQAENDELRDRLSDLEDRVDRLDDGTVSPAEGD